MENLQHIKQTNLPITFKREILWNYTLDKIGMKISCDNNSNNNWIRRRRKRVNKLSCQQTTYCMWDLYQDSIHLQMGRKIQQESEYEINLYSKESLHDQLIETLQEKHLMNFQRLLR